jgi:hypothetical protein
MAEEGGLSPSFLFDIGDELLPDWILFIYLYYTHKDL